MTTHPTSRWIDDVLDIVWPVLVLSALLVAATSLSDGSAARLLLTLIAVLVFPGYALSLFVFPLASTREQGHDGSLSNRLGWTLSSLGTVERLAVAVGFSICLMPVYGFLVAVAELSFALETILAVVLAVTAVLTVLGLVRRRRLPADVDAPVPGRPALLRFVRAVTTSDGNASLSNVVVVVTLLAAVSALMVGIALPPASAQYTTASLLTTGADGELVAAGYPHDLAPEEKADLVLVLSNDERRVVDYTVVVQSQRVALDGTVTERQHLDQFAVQLRDGETWERPHQVAPLLDGDRVQLAYLIYRGDPPANPTTENAYRSLTLWVREPMPGTTSQTEVTSVAMPDTVQASFVGADSEPTPKTATGENTVRPAPVVNSR